MALPATFFLEPESLDDLELPPGVDQTDLTQFGQQVRELVGEYRQHPPEEGSEEEHRFFIRYLSATLETTSLLRVSFSVTLQQSTMRVLKKLVEKEYAATDVERKFALRQLQRAVEAHGVLLEQFGQFASGQTPEVLDAFLVELRNDLVRDELLLSQGDQIVVRFQLDLLAALTALDGPLDELTQMAFRAATGARRVEALGNLMRPAIFRTELKRIKARTAWLDWTRQDAEQELEPNSPESIFCKNANLSS